ncbi:helix-turn-helix domain-containing protein [Mailhella sp.]|uniref:helix-turn-helix domain-containing protein n=1 Tax=Mailhella sp. TaxID=1981029 RepID=UPI004063CA7A
MDKDEKIVHKSMPIVLRRFRDRVGLSQQELADSIEVSKGFISALEGGRSVPSLGRPLILSDTFQVSLATLMEALMKEIGKNKKTILF